MQLGYFGIGARDLGAWEEFGTAVLGLHSTGRDAEGALVFRMDAHQRRIVVHPSSDEDLLYAGWEVRNAEELAAFAKRLDSAGVAVEYPGAGPAAARGVRELIRFKDPDGLTTELYYGAVTAQDRPMRSPRAVSGFVTGAQGLGHLVVRAANVRATTRFYCDVLAFGLSDFIQMQVAPDVVLEVPFLHCNPRHHSLALLGAPLPKRLQHFMVEVRTLDDVGFAWDLAKRRGIEITLDLGRHSNDHMVSFYMRTPSGCDVEYGFGARVIDNEWAVEQHTVISSWGHHGPAAASETR